MPTIYKNQVSSNQKAFKKNLMCIEYPGHVKNAEKAIATLGGLDNIGIAYGIKNRRVELRFRPDDLYCKPACAEKHSVTAMLIKVKVKRKLRDPNEPCSSKDADEPLKILFDTKLVGVVDTVFKFENICDFQYLPMSLKKGEEVGGKCEYIYEKLRPTSVPTSEWMTDKDKDVPYFLTPPVFSRFDTVHYYNAMRSKSDVHTDQNIIGRLRRRRAGHAYMLHYKDAQIPNKPHPEAVKMLHIKFLNERHYEFLKQLFEERPIWSKNALSQKTKFSKEQLKYLLPTVAFYFLTGPWRIMWIRFGYDPRLVPESKYYQTFDYRLRTIGGLKNKVKAKRSYSNYLLPYKSSPSSRPKVAIINRHSMVKAFQDAREDSMKNIPDENTYIFRPGTIPATRQMFYQYCDVHVPEIQALLNNLPATKPGEKCDPRTGWLPINFDNRCREIVNNLVLAEIRKKMQEEQSSQPTAGPSSQDMEVETGKLPSPQNKEPDEEICDGEIEISDSDGEMGLNEEEEDDLSDSTDEIIDSEMEDSLQQ